MCISIIGAIAMSIGDRVLVASGNPAKLAELRRLLEGSGIAAAGPSELGLRLQVEETGDTFEANAILKAEAASREAGLPAIADDSGLEVDALQGEPGIRSARFAGPGADDQERSRLILARLRGVPPANRTARFVSTVAVARPGETTVVFRGEVEGVISERPRGSGGFGYDPIFYYPPLARTFGELTPEEKGQVSHRGKALRQAVAFLRGSR